MSTQTIEFIRPAKQPATQRWSVDEVEALFKLPFSDLLYRAQQLHREYFDPNAVQLSTLLSIKTGGCTEDCGYCPQSAFNSSGVEDRKMLEVEAVVEAKHSDSSRSSSFFMGDMIVAFIDSSHYGQAQCSKKAARHGQRGAKCAELRLGQNNKCLLAASVSI